MYSRTHPYRVAKASLVLYSFRSNSRLPNAGLGEHERCLLVLAPRIGAGGLSQDTDDYLKGRDIRSTHIFWEQQL